MTNVREIKPVANVSGAVRVPGSKSLTNRVLICAALASGQSILRNASDSNDTALLVNGLNQMGVLARKSGDSLVVEGTGGKLFGPKFPIPVGNAGTTLRFLLSLAALASGDTTFDCDFRMMERPLDDLVVALKQQGVDVQIRGTKVSIHGSGLKGGQILIDASKSSQFVSSFLLVSSYAENDVELSIGGNPVSTSYSTMTLDVMRSFGVVVERLGEQVYKVKSHQRYAPTTFDIEPDASGASYFLATAAITGGEVTIEGMKTPSTQGDAHFPDILEKMGCEISRNASGVQCKGPKVLQGIEVDMNSMPDVVPTLVVTALFAKGPTRIRNVAHLKYKESDRLGTLAEELKKTGADIAVLDDGFTINPSALHGAQLATYDDHRLAMSFALLGLRVPGIKVENPDCVKKSFPQFWDVFDKLCTSHS